MMSTTLGRMGTFPSRMLQALTAGRRVDPSQPDAERQPLEKAISSGRHLLVRGPDMQSEILRVKQIVEGWMRRRDEWHVRMEDANIDLGRFVVTLDDAPLRKGVYAFHGGPFATTPGIRRIRDPDLGSDMISGILMIGRMDRSHFAIASQSRWTLVGCAGGGWETIEDLLVDDFEDVLHHRRSHHVRAT